MTQWNFIEGLQLLLLANVCHFAEGKRVYALNMAISKENSLINMA